MLYKTKATDLKSHLFGTVNQKASLDPVRSLPEAYIRPYVNCSHADATDTASENSTAENFGDIQFMLIIRTVFITVFQHFRPSLRFENYPEKRPDEQRKMPVSGQRKH